MTENFIKKAESKLSEMENIMQNILNKKHSYEEKIINMNNDIDQIKNYIQKDHEYSSYANNDISSEQSAMSDFIKKGIVSNLITKDITASENNGEVVLQPSLQNKILAEIKNRSVMRRLAHVVNISNSSIKLIKQEGDFETGWVGSLEARKVTDTPELISQEIPVHEIFAQPRIDPKILNDSKIQLDQWIINQIAEMFAYKENEAFIIGNGDNKPKGIMHDIDNSRSLDIKRNEFNADLLDSVIDLLPEKYMNNACFLMNRKTLSVIRNLKDRNGRFIWERSLNEDSKNTIYGYPVEFCEHIPHLDNDDGKISIIFGDIKSAYMIVDRQKTTFIRDVYTDKPYLKIYSVRRVGGDIIDNKAIISIRVKK